MLDLLLGGDQFLVRRPQADGHVLGKDAVQQQEKIQFFLLGGVGGQAARGAGVDGEANGLAEGLDRGRPVHAVDDAHFAEDLALLVDDADLQTLLADADLPGEQKVKPGVGIALVDDGLAVLVFPDFAELEQLAEALGLEVPQVGDRHQLLDVLDVVLEIFRFDHKTPRSLSLPDSAEIVTMPADG